MFEAGESDVATLSTRSLPVISQNPNRSVDRPGGRPCRIARLWRLPPVYDRVPSEEEILADLSCRATFHLPGSCFENAEQACAWVLRWTTSTRKRR